MKSSNLAECLEEFAATIVAVDIPKEKSPHVVAVEVCGPPRRAARRLSLESRRIQIRDTGLPQFRVF
jgi:hypothetical protein